MANDICYLIKVQFWNLIQKFLKNIPPRKWALQLHKLFQNFKTHHILLAVISSNVVQIKHLQTPLEELQTVGSSTLILLPHQSKIHAAYNIRLYEVRQMPCTPCTRTHHAPRHTMHQDTPCTRTHHAPGHTMHQGTPCTRTHHAPGNTMHQDTPCTTTHHAPRHTMHQDTPCTRTHHAPGHTMHQGTPCTRTHHAPGNTMHQDTPCTRTHHAPGHTMHQGILQCFLPYSLGQPAQSVGSICKFGTIYGWANVPWLVCPSAWCVRHISGFVEPK